jgi:diguanylate cyclase (GGDEF)-like protein
VRRPRTPDRGKPDIAKRMTKPGLSFSQEELKGFSRTVAELEWLTLVLVLLYLVVEAPKPEARLPITTALFFYGAFVVGFHYFHFYREESRVRLTVETLVMIAFVTWVVWFTGELESPLLNLYLIPVITAALTLGKLTTLLEVLLIVACFVLLGYQGGDTPSVMNAAYAGQLAARLAPILLVAYLVTMFSADIHDAMRKMRLMSDTDGDTGLLTPGALVSLLEREVERCTRYERPFSVLTVEVGALSGRDRFWQRDRALRLTRHVTDLLQGELRSSDVVAKMNEDEFAILLTETDLASALLVAHRLRTVLAASPWRSRNRSVSLQARLGVGAYPEHGKGGEELLARAEQAMAAEPETVAELRSQQSA